MAGRRLPGIYVDQEKTNPASRRVPALATGVMIIDANKGMLNERDIVTSPAEFLAKYGTKSHAANKLDHLAALAFLERGVALYVTRVRAADTASKAVLVVDEDTLGSESGSGGGGELSADRYITTDIETDWNDNGPGVFNSGAGQYDSEYSSENNRSQIQIILDPSSLFVDANKFKLRFTHTTGFPIQLDIFDETGNNYHTDGYISGTEIDLRLSGLVATERWTLNMLVLGLASYSVSNIRFFIFGPDADVIEGV